MRLKGITRGSKVSFNAISNVQRLYLHIRELCELIGEKTNVYSLEVSMWGHDVQVEKKLTKREIEKLGVSTIPMETKTLPYTKESCKLRFKLSR